MELSFKLHPAQMEIFNSKARFKVAACGRRFGKSYLAAVTLLIEALKSKNQHGYDLSQKDVFYIAPTFPQGKDIMWRLIKDLGKEITEQAYEQTGVLKLINGRHIHIKGSDRPDTLRGVGLSYVVLDEFASMKPQTWEEIIRPTLADVKGGALFIGTPAGKNHFYDLYLKGDEEEDWDTFSFNSTDNPFLDPTEIDSARKIMSTTAFRQEFEASFQTGGGNLFEEDWIKVDKIEPEEGDYYLSIDLAGFADIPKQLNSKLKRFDETAISIVKVNTDGWWVKDIQAGRWGIRETSIRILRIAQQMRPKAIGIEKGALKNAIMPYLQDQMRRLNIYPKIVETTHGSKKKIDRITWALQGRMQNGRIKFNDGLYLRKLREQFMDFPNPMSHDDLLDSLAYIDQVATVIYNDNFVIDDWAPLDNVIGI